MGLITWAGRKIATEIAKSFELSSAPSTVFSGISIAGDDTPKLTRPYEQLAVVHAAIRAKAVNLAQVPFRIYRIGADEPEAGGPIVGLFEKPNTHMTTYDLWEWTVTMLDLYGGAPVYPDQEVTRDGVPISLWPVAPSKLEVRKSNNAPIGWWVDFGNGKEFLAWDELVYPKYVHPRDSILGLAPLKALSMSLEGEWSAINYNQRFFDQGQTLGAVFSTDKALGDAQFKRMKDQLIERRKGLDGAHKSLLLDSGVKVVSQAITQKDMQFIDLRKYTRDEILMVFKVPKAELGIYEDINYATAQSQDEGFWRKSLIPLGRRIEAAYNHTILNKLGFVGRFDFQSVDALNQDILDKAESAQKYYEMGVPFNVINVRLSLGFPEVEQGDIPFSGKTEPAATLQQNSAAKIKALYGGSLQVQSVADGWTKAERTAKWKKLTDEVSPIQGKLRRAVRSYFYDIERSIVKRLVKAADIEGAQAKDKVKDEFEWVADMFSDEDLRKTAEEYVREAVVAGFATVSTEIMPDRMVIEAVNERFKKLTGVNETARAEIMKKLRDVLEEQIAAGATTQEIAQALAAGVKDQFAITKKRAVTIARTETLSAFSKGRVDAAESVGFKFKMWISSRDSLIRDSHSALDGQKVPFEGNYSNGLKFPHDPSGPDKEVINCRCVEVYLDE